MDNYKKLYLKIAIFYFLFAIILSILTLYFFRYITFLLAGQKGDDSYDTHIGSLSTSLLILSIIIGVAPALLSSWSFKIIRKDLTDAKWTFVEYDNIQFKLPSSEVYDKCINCISSLKWTLLEVRIISEDINKIKRIIGVTNLGYRLYHEIFIIDVSGLKKGITTVHCSVRPLSVTYAVGKRRCKRRLEKLMGCLSSE